MNQTDDLYAFVEKMRDYLHFLHKNLHILIICITFAENFQ